MFIKVLLISVVLISFFFVGLGIKILVKKEGKFEKSCGSVDPKTGKKLPCSCSSSGGGGECHNS